MVRRYHRELGRVGHQAAIVGAGSPHAQLLAVRETGGKGR